MSHLQIVLAAPPIQLFWRIGGSTLFFPDVAAACAEEGWVPTEPDEATATFVDAQDQPRLFCTFAQGRLLSAYTPLCYLEEFDPEFHPSEASYREARAELDEVYDAQLARARALLGEPAREGRDTDATAYRHAIWTAPHALVILQQAAVDPQFGDEVDFWIQRWTGALPRTTSPLVDWLTARDG